MILVNEYRIINKTKIVHFIVSQLVYFIKVHIGKDFQVHRTMRLRSRPVLVHSFALLEYKT